MAHRKTLTEAQLSVLKWISEDCPDGVMDGYAHRVSAAALRQRGLVRTSGRGPTWSAKVTSEGKDYLERAAGPDPPTPRQANKSVTEQLVSDVIAAGGSLRVPQKRYYDREGVDYANRAMLAERYRKVPEGKRLAVKRISADELEIHLVDAPEGAPSSFDPVPVPERVARYHPVVRQFRRMSDRHEVSRAALPRASRILQGLVVEAERRGHQVEIAPDVEPDGYRSPKWSGTNQGHIVITANGYSAPIRVTEEGLPSRTHWEQQNRTYRPYIGDLGIDYRPSPPPLTKYEAGATGRLTLALLTGYGRRGRPTKWSDRKSWTLEEKLPELLWEIEMRAVEAEEQRREAERRAAERQRAWEAAMERARVRHAEAHRAEVLSAEAKRWREAEAIRAYCDAIESAYPDDAEAMEWVSWGRAYAAGIDPLDQPPRPPPPPESVSPNELRPYMEGWSPYGPDGHRW